MSKFQFIEHNGKRIFYLDFKGVEMEKVSGILDEAKPVVSDQPPKSVRHLTDVTGTSFSKQIIQQFKAYAHHNEPFIYRSAAVGVSGLMVVLFNAVVKFSGRSNLVLKSSMQEALDWLAEGD